MAASAAFFSPAPDSRPCNYMSAEYQTAFDNGWRKYTVEPVVKRLGAYIASKEKLKPEEKSADGKKLALAKKTLTEIKTIADKKISTDRRALIKRNAEMTAIVKTARDEYKSLGVKTGELSRCFSEARSLCKSANSQLENFLDIGIYEVKLSEKDFEELKKSSDSEIFYYEGRKTATAKAMGGVVTTALGLAVCWLDGGGALIVGSIPLRQGLSRYGYAIRKDIPSESISHQVTLQRKDTDRIHIASRQANNKFQAPDSKEIVTLYMLDARDPASVLADGTNYHLNEKHEGKSINPFGHVILFSNPSDALNCAALRSYDAAKYDLCGWRLHNDWTNQERKAVHDQCQQMMVVNHTARRRSYS